MEQSTKETAAFIIETARGMFMKSGYRAVSTRQIAEACGITQPALYHHFKNKKALYVEVLRIVLQETEHALLKICQGEAPLREKTTALFRYFLTDHQYDLSQMFHDMLEEFDETTQRLVYEWWAKSFLQPVIGMLMAAKNRQELKPLSEFGTNETELAYLILNMIKSAMDPAVMRRFTDEEKVEEIARLSNLYTNVILSGIEKDR